jgi:hypothetical protein
VTVTFSCTDAISGVTQFPQPQTFSSNVKGATATATCTSVAGTTATATYGPINIDTTTPAIQFAGISPTPNGSGWNNTAVTATWSCSDSVSGPVAATVTQTVSQNGAGQSATGTCTNLAGATASNTRSGINIDTTKPTVTGTPSSQPNANGWWSAPVTITWSCTDNVSGVASQPQAQTFSSNVRGGTATATCTSVAGTTGTGTYSPINIDMSAPAIQFAAVSPSPNAHGWNNTPVTVSWSCSDSVSGPVSATVSQTVSAEGAGQSATGTCTNLAGFTASNTHSGVNIDLTPPQVQLISPVNGFNYTQGQTIAASYSCADGLSGVATCTGTLPSGTRITLSNTGTFTFTVTATDQAGNQTTATNTYNVVPGTR